MSAVLQALIRLPPFVHDLCSCVPLLEGSAAPGNSSLLTALVDVNTAVCSGGHKVIKPEALKECISRRSPQFAGDGQQDAHEFLTDLLDFLEAEVRERSAQTASQRQEQICPTALNFRCVIGKW